MSYGFSVKSSSIKLTACILLPLDCSLPRMCFQASPSSGQATASYIFHPLEQNALHLSDQIQQHACSQCKSLHTRCQTWIDINVPYKFQQAWPVLKIPKTYRLMDCQTGSHPAAFLWTKPTVIASKLPLCKLPTELPVYYVAAGRP